MWKRGGMLRRWEYRYNEVLGESSVRIRCTMGCARSCSSSSRQIRRHIFMAGKEK